MATGANYTESTENRSADVFIKTGVKGIIMAPKSHSQTVYDRFIEEKIPVVVLDTRLPGCDEDFVGIDDLRGTEIATRHLVELGHTRIAYVGPIQLYCAMERSQVDRQVGFMRVCIQSGLKNYKIWDIETKDEGFITERGIVDFRSFLNRENRPTAIVAFNDMWADLVIKVAQDVGLKVPDDLSVVGFDNSELSKNNSVPITTVNPKPKQLGEIAIDLLIDKIAYPHNNHCNRNILIIPELIVRESTRKTGKTPVEGFESRKKSEDKPGTNSGGMGTIHEDKKVYMPCDKGAF